MYYVLVVLLVSAGLSPGEGNLWPNGIVNYAFNPQHYDLHSQEIIEGVMIALEKEVCIRFHLSPDSPPPENATTSKRLLYITNPNKTKSCPPQAHKYDYNLNVVKMPIGYRCLQEKEIARVVFDMIIATFKDPSVADSVRNSGAQPAASQYLSPSERSLIDAQYSNECLARSPAFAHPAPPALRTGDGRGQVVRQLSPENVAYYSSKLWPMGIVMYTVDPELRGSPAHLELKKAMARIEMETCIVFHFTEEVDSQLAWKHLLYFGQGGQPRPQLGFQSGKQTINLLEMMAGARGHVAHGVNNLMRALGVSMMSNRYDRDNYVKIHWHRVTRGLEHLLQKEPREAWVESINYAFTSVTHAPTNFACDTCELGDATVEPIMDHLWERRQSMGHSDKLSFSDGTLLDLLYSSECEQRGV